MGICGRQWISPRGGVYKWERALVCVCEGGSVWWRMQLRLEAPTGAEYIEGGHQQPDPEVDEWVASKSGGAAGFYEGLAYVYVTLADIAWSDEYWPADGSQPDNPVDEPPPILTTNHEQQLAAETRGTLKRIDKLFRTLNVDNPENPPPNPDDPLDAGRRAVHTDPAKRDRQVRALDMAEQLSVLIQTWIKTQVRKGKIFEIFSPDEVDKKLLEDAEEMWKNLDLGARRDLEPMLPNASHEVRGIFRLSEALQYTVINPWERDRVSDLEMELAVRVLDIFLFQYADDGTTLYSIRGKKQYGKKTPPAPLDSTNPDDYVIGVAFRYDAYTKKYEFNCENSTRLQTNNVSMQWPNPSQGNGRDAARAREEDLRRRLEVIGGKRESDGRQGVPTMSQQAVGASSLTNANATVAELAAAGRKDEEAAQDYKQWLVADQRRRREEVEQAKFLTQRQEKEARKKREDERKRELGLAESKLIMRGFVRDNRKQKLLNADEAEPWTWEDLKNAMNRNGSNLQKRYRQAVAILVARAQKEDAKGYEKYLRKKDEIDAQIRENMRQNEKRADVISRTGIEPYPRLKTSGFKNNYGSYKWREKTPDGKNWAHPELYYKIKSSHDTAWQRRNEGKPGYVKIQDAIARDLWVRYHGHPLRSYKVCFPEKSESYYRSATQTHYDVKDYMRGQMSRPDVPATSGTDAHAARTPKEIRTTDALRCQTYELMYVNYQIADDPRMAWMTTRMLEPEKARLQLEYEAFMADERRHLLDVLRACGPDPEAPHHPDVPGCLERCYDADKDSYALCPPEELDADGKKKKKAASGGGGGGAKRYDYERPCKGEAPSEIDGVKLLGGAQGDKVPSKGMWVEPARKERTEEEAKAWVLEMQKLARKAREDYTKPGTNPILKDLIDKAYKKHRLFNVNGGKPCAYGKMPEPDDKDHYYTAFARLMEFEQEAKVSGVLNQEDSPTRYKNFWHSPEQNPLTTRVLNKTYDKKTEGKGENDKGILKIILIEWIKEAERVDEDYNDPAWIGPAHANQFFDKNGDFFRYKKNRDAVYAKGGNGPLVAKKQGATKLVEVPYKPYFITKYINIFQSDLVECFPAPAGENQFNDIMDFICWYMTNCWSEWGDKEHALNNLWDKLCQHACVPILSTWKPGDKLPKDEANFYDAYTLNNKILETLRELWRAVTFCKKALDFAVKNKNGILYQVHDVTLAEGEMWEARWIQENEIRRRILTKWCSLTEGPPCQIPGAPDEDELMGDDDEEDGGEEDDEDDGEGDEPPSMLQVNDAIRDIIRKHDDYHTLSVNQIKKELADWLHKKNAKSEELDKDTWKTIRSIIKAESKIAGVNIALVVKACHNVAQRMEVEDNLKFSEADALILRWLQAKKYPVDVDEWKTRKEAIKILWQHAVRLRNYHEELSAEIKKTPPMMRLATLFASKYLNAAQKVQVAALQSAIEAAIFERDRIDNFVPERTKEVLNDLQGHVNAVSKMLAEVEAARHAPPPKAESSDDSDDDVPLDQRHLKKVVVHQKAGIAQDRPRRTGEGARAGDGEIKEIVERIVLPNPKRGKLIMIGYWASSHAPTSAYCTTPLFGTIDQWTQIFEAAANHSRLAILIVKGTALPEKRQSPFLELLAEWLPRMHIIALNVGEMDSASPEAVDALTQALEHEDCIVGHMFYESAFISPEQTRRMKNALTRNRHKLGYYQQLVRDEVYELGGANCWTNFSGRLYTRATQRLADEAGYEAEEDEAKRTQMQLEALAEDKAAAEAAIVQNTEHAKKKKKK